MNAMTITNKGDEREKSGNKKLGRQPTKAKRWREEWEWEWEREIREWCNERKRGKVNKKSTRF